MTDELTIIDGPPRCPYCDRVMSTREHAEQGACNDCYDAHRWEGAPTW